MGRAEAGKRRDAEELLLRGPAERVDFIRAFDQFQMVLQPENHRANRVDGAFQGVVQPVTGRPGDRIQQAGPSVWPVADVPEQEAAGAVGQRKMAGPIAALADERRLLIADAGENRDRLSTHDRLAVEGRRRQNPGQNGGWNLKEFEQLRIPTARGKIHHQGARCIGVVGGMDGASGELPHEIAVDRAEEQLAGLGPPSHTRQMAQEPVEFPDRRMGGQPQPRSSVNHPLVTGLLGADTAAPPILPTDGPADGFAALAVPEQKGRALIGHANRGDFPPALFAQPVQRPA